MDKKNLAQNLKWKEQSDEKPSDEKLVFTEHPMANAVLLSDTTWRAELIEGRITPAFSAVSTEVHSSTLRMVAIHFAYLAATLLLSGVLAIAGGSAVQLGYDWGYKLVEAFIGQTNGSAQGGVANISLFFLIIPMFFGISFGCVTRLWTTSRRWAKSVTVTGFGAVSALSFLAGRNLFGANPWEASIYAVSALLFGLFGFWAGRQYFSILRKRVRIRALLACASASVGLLGLAWLIPDVAFGVEMLLYALILAAAGAWAAVFARARCRSGAILLAFAATMPILLANFANVFGNLLGLLLDTFGVGPGLGWHALLSAAAISTLAITAASSGALIGYRMCNRSASVAKT